jgi:hypothetical protein
MKMDREKKTVSRQGTSRAEELTADLSTPHGLYDEERLGLLKTWRNTADLVANFYSNAQLSAIITSTIGDLAHNEKEKTAARERLTDELPTLRLLRGCVPPNLWPDGICGEQATVQRKRA